MQSCYIAQTRLKFVGSSDSSSSAFQGAGTIDVHHNPQLSRKLLEET
jgi:hypothetical protein